MWLFICNAFDAVILLLQAPGPVSLMEHAFKLLLNFSFTCTSHQAAFYFLKTSSWCAFYNNQLLKFKKKKKIFILRLQRKVAKNMWSKKKGTEAKEICISRFWPVEIQGRTEIASYDTAWLFFLQCFLHLITSPSKCGCLIFKLRCLLEHLYKLLNFYNLKIHLIGQQGVL